MTSRENKRWANHLVLEEGFRENIPPAEDRKKLAQAREIGRREIAKMFLFGLGGKGGTPRGGQGAYGGAKGRFPKKT